jgi:hypothetical protein
VTLRFGATTAITKPANRDEHFPEVEMHKSIKPIVAGVGVAALLALGLNAAMESPGTTSSYSSGGTAGETITMSPDATTLETASFVPAEKAAAPCGFAQSGGC